MLTMREKDNLYSIIEAVIGDDPSIKASRHHFNERTVDVVEKMLASSNECNANMRDLIVELIGKGKLLTKGWLRKVLNKSEKFLSKSKLHGYGCLVVVKSSWKQQILMTTF